MCLQRPDAWMYSLHHILPVIVLFRFHKPRLVRPMLRCGELSRSTFEVALSSYWDGPF